MTKIQEKKSFIALTPCFIHIINICEKQAFRHLPGDIEKFYKSVYSYFAKSLHKNEEFLSLQQKLGIDTTLLTQPAHTRWSSWHKTVTKTNQKWLALKQYFADKGGEQKRLFQRLIRLCDIPILNEDSELNSNDALVIQNQTEKFIKKSLEGYETYFYSVFLEKALSHSVKYVKLFEEDNYDVSKIYSLMKDYMEFYINKLRRFEYLSLTTEEVMHLIKSKQFENKCMMHIAEYEEEFIKDFRQLDLTLFTDEIKKTFLKNTQNYYFKILQTIVQYIDLDNNIFKDLRLLDIRRKPESTSELLLWRSIANRFSYLYDHKHDDFKKEFADFLTLDFSLFSEDHSMLQWKLVKEMKKGIQPRFICLIQLVQGLLTIPYSNASIERVFSQLKLTKSIKRLKLKTENLECFMTLKNLMRKRKVQDFDSLLSFETLKKVRKTVQDEIAEKNEDKKNKHQKLDKEKFVIN